MGTRFYVALIIVLLVLIFYERYYKHSEHNHVTIPRCHHGRCEYFHVNKTFKDNGEAARMMQQVTANCRALITHLKEKYMAPRFSGVRDPNKNNRIDVVEIDPILSEELFDSLADQEYLAERIKQLARNYDSDNIYEIGPNNLMGVTSYTEDKKKLILCLRDKKHSQLHDINTIMFVVLHEMAHMMNKTWNHPHEFWVLFRFLLANAVEIGIYEPVDYSKHPIVYCGLHLGSSPLFADISRMGD